MRFILLVLASLSTWVWADEGVISTGPSPLYSSSTTLTVTGDTASVIAVSMLRSKGAGSRTITVSEGTVTGENFTCRAIEGNKYICYANFNVGAKGELRPVDLGSSL